MIQQFIRHRKGKGLTMTVTYEQIGLLYIKFNGNRHIIILLLF